MNTPVPPPQALRAAIRAAEEALADLTRARQAAPEFEPREARGRLEDALEALDQAEREVGSSPGVSSERPAPRTARLASVRARAALQERAVPEAAFEGLYEAVRAGATADRWGRAGMSGAFLDAPRTLARWRFVASAASLLLFIGGAVLLQGGLAWDSGDPSRALHDPRDDLLQRIDETPRASASARAAPRLASPEGTERLRPVGHAASLEQPGASRQQSSRQQPSRRQPSRRQPSRQQPRPHGYISFHFGWGGPGVARSRRVDAQALDAAGRQLRLLFPPLGRDAGTGPESN